MAPTIFILVPAYRDPELVPTVRDCLARADVPEALRFGICLQDDLTRFGNPFAGEPNIRVDLVDHRESRGAGWARHRAQALYDGEDYCLYLDAHHRFEPGWDRALVAMLESIDCERPLLTAYPPPYDPADGARACGDTPNTIGVFGFTSWGCPVWEPVPILDHRERSAPIAGRSIAFGFLFAHGHFCAHVPIDPEIYFIGEETALAVRAFTHGYDIFHPHRALLYHYYARPDGARHWADHDAAAWSALDRTAQRRVRALLGIEGDARELGDYGPGDVRSVEDYEAYAGIDLRSSLLDPHTLARRPPPAPDRGPRRRVVPRQTLARIDLPPEAIDRAQVHDCWRLTLFDPLGVERHHAQLAPDSIQAILREDPPSFVVRYRTPVKGGRWTLVSHLAGRGWEPLADGSL